MSSTTLRIATRQSALALWQAQHVASQLQTAHRNLQIKLLPMSTRGDWIIDQPLTSIGGKGLFLKELETVLLEGGAELAVHSLKDVPSALTPGFVLPAILPRAPVADALVSNHHASMAALPRGARVGSSSLRRQAQLRAQRDDLHLLDLRGNVNTRLSRLDSGQYDAIILASAGLERLELGSRIRARLEPPHWLPAPGQAAIALEACADRPDVHSLVAVLDDTSTRIAVSAERAMSQALGGGCTMPVGAWCEVSRSRLHLHGMVGDARSGHLLTARASSLHARPEALGQRVAQMLLEQGAGSLLAG